MFQWMSKKLNQKRKGFTLIELVVVIAILGILAALAIPRLTGSRLTAAQNTHLGNIRTIESAATIYMAEKNATDVSMSDLVPGYLQENPKVPELIGTGVYGVSVVNNVITVTYTPN